MKYAVKKEFTDEELIQRVTDVMEIRNVMGRHAYYHAKGLHERELKEIWVQKPENDFETRFCEKLFEKGFWVHNMTQNSAGQPADVIAVRDGKAYLIDCKVCTGGRFSLNRIEENQHSAMNLWKDSGNGIGWFALEYQGSIFMVDHDTLVELSEQQMSMNYNDICCHTIPLEGWLLIC